MAKNASGYGTDRFGNFYGPQLSTPVGRIVYPALKNARADTRDPIEGQGPRPDRWQATVLLDKKNKEVKKWIASIEEEGQAMLTAFNKAAKARGEKLKISCDSVVIDGDEFLAAKAGRAEKNPFYAGHWVIQADLPASNGKTAPESFNAKLKPIDGDTIVGGMLCSLAVALCIFKSGPKFRLQGVQLVKDDGVRLGATQKSAKDLFAAIGTDEGEDDETEESADEDTESVETEEEEETESEDADESDEESNDEDADSEEDDDNDSDSDDGESEDSDDDDDSEDESDSSDEEVDEDDDDEEEEEKPAKKSKKAAKPVAAKAAKSSAVKKAVNLLA